MEKLKLAYRPHEVAEALGVSDRTIYVLIARGKLRAMKEGRAVLVTRAAIDEYLARGETEAEQARMLTAASSSTPAAE